MKIIHISLLVIATIFAISAFANVRVQGYYRQNGTYIQPHYRTDPNYIRHDNWAVKGNVNPYTGKKGTQDPWSNPYNTR